MLNTCNYLCCSNLKHTGKLTIYILNVKYQNIASDVSNTLHLAGYIRVNSDWITEKTLNYLILLNVWLHLAESKPPFVDYFSMPRLVR